MANIGYATLQVIPSMAGVQQKMTTGLTGPMSAAGSTAGDKAGKGFKSKFGSAIKGFAAPLAGVAIGAAVTKFFSSSIEEAREAQKVGAQTAAVLKSTKNAANVTADAIGNYAEKLSLKTGIDDEAIQSGENLLLTFTKIRNETGKNNDIFNQATTAALDMSVAMGTDMRSSALQVGKALNDPIKGMSALSRVGVSFTDKQKTMVERWVEQGKSLDAQKFILRELTKEFGGSAEAQATAGDKAAVAWANIQEQVGTALLPVLDRFLTFVSTKIIPAVSEFVDWLSALGDSGSGASEMASQVQGALGGLGDTFRGLVDTVKALIAGWQAIWAKYGDIIMKYLVGTIRNAITVLQGAFQIIEGIFQVVTGILTGDWSKAWEGIKNILGGAVKLIVGLIRQAWNLITTLFRIGGRLLGTIWSGIWNGIKKLAKAAFDALVNLVKSGLSKALDLIKAYPGLVKSAWSGLGRLVAGLIRAAFSGLASLVNRGLDAVVNAVKALPGKIRDLAGAMLDAGRAIIEAFLRGLGQVGSFAGQLAEDIFGAITSKLEGFINFLIQSLNDAIPDKISVPKAPDIPLPDDPFPTLGEGGIVTRPTFALIGEKGPEAVLPLNGKQPTGHDIHITVNNPIEERSSQSIQRTLHDIAQLGLLDGGQRREIVLHA